MANARVFWYRLGSGFLIGSAMVIPGVSGAVLAMVLGLYEPIITAVAKPLVNWRANIKLLAPLGLGAGSSLLLLAKMLEFLFAQHPLPTLYFFFGLVLASIPSIVGLANSKGFRLSFLVSFTLGVVVLFWVIRIPSLFGDGFSLNPSLWISLLKGALVGVGLVIPGLSSSLLLIAFGFYEELLRAVAQLNWPMLIPVIFGLVPTVLLASNGINWLFKWKMGHVYYAILGLMAGSLLMAFPGWPRTGFEIVLCLGLFGAGIVIASLFTQTQT